MTFEDRVRALEPFGFTARQTRFLATAALHSGYCLRRQYSAFAGIRCGKNVRNFLETLVERRLVEKFTLRADRGLIYHLAARGIYRAIGEEDNRNRREVSAALIARRIMVLDYVLGHPQREWLATERERVDLFTKRCGVPRAGLPQRMSAASTSTSATRYFIPGRDEGVMSFNASTRRSVWSGWGDQSRGSSLSATTLPRRTRRPATTSDRSDVRTVMPSRAALAVPPVCGNCRRRSIDSPTTIRHWRKSGSCVLTRSRFIERLMVSGLRVPAVIAR
jgi:hypothetical protein